jgi:hypothetical protein
MTSLPSDRPVSALRARMSEDMNVRGFSEKTRNDYIRNVRAFAAFVGRSPDTATAGGRKDRQAMLSPQLLELLRAWWREGRRLGVLLPRGWLFPGRNPLEAVKKRCMDLWVLKTFIRVNRHRRPRCAQGNRGGGSCKLFALRIRTRRSKEQAMRAFAVGSFGEAEPSYRKLIYWHGTEKRGRFPV